MWRGRSALQSVPAVALGIVVAGMCFLLGRSTAPAAALPQPLSIRVGAPVRQHFVSANATGGPVQPELLAAAHAAANEEGAVIIATANQAAMLHQMPTFMAALHGQPESPPVACSLIIVTFDVIAQRLCVRQHKARLCVLDSWESTKLGVDRAALADALRGNAGWGSPAFRAMTWRKWELVHDLLLQGFSVLSMDLDITLFRNPLSPQVNPWMRPEVEMIVAQDSSVTGMFNCGFFFVRPVPSVMAFFQIWLGAAYNAKDPLDVWDQGVYNETLLFNPTGIRRHTLGQTWFADMCFLTDVRAALVLNAGAVLDAHVFGDAFDGMLDVLEAWDTIFGFHTPCCYSGIFAFPEPASQECKVVANSLSLLRWQRHEKPWERFIQQHDGLPECDGLDSEAEQSGQDTGQRRLSIKDFPLRIPKPATAAAEQINASSSTAAAASRAARVPLLTLEELEVIRLRTQEVRDKHKGKVLRKVKPFGRRESDTLQ